VDLLLHHGAKVNAQDLKNNTAAMVACFFNKPRILTTLIRAGADLAVRNNEAKDAYDVAVEKEFDECKELVAKALEKRGIKAGNNANANATATDKLTEDVDKLKLKH
jgi:ankyrin repeat protein